MKKNRCQKCNAYCCRHVAIGIDTPEDESDYDCIRWYLLHKNVWVAIDFLDNWLVEFKTPCRLITDEFKCGDYPNRPQICKDYPEDDEYCEGETDLPSCKHLFKSLKDFEKYLDENKSKTRKR
jgi:Fe-S-cluster containining protein